MYIVHTYRVTSCTQNVVTNYVIYDECYNIILYYITIRITAVVKEIIAMTIFKIYSLLFFITCYINVNYFLIDNFRSGKRRCYLILYWRIIVFKNTF